MHARNFFADLARPKLRSPACLKGFTQSDRFLAKIASTSCLWEKGRW